MFAIEVIYFAVTYIESVRIQTSCQIPTLGTGTCHMSREINQPLVGSTPALGDSRRHSGDPHPLGGSPLRSMRVDVPSVCHTVCWHAQHSRAASHEHPRREAFRRHAQIDDVWDGSRPARR